jgi:predicted metalloprotease with PDZ domain
VKARAFLTTTLWLVLTSFPITQSPFTQSPITYRLSFSEAQHHRMEVEVTFPDVPGGPLQVMMSRTSPGRYAVHEFARNVFDVHIDDGRGAPLRVERPGASQWDVVGHSGTVRVRYKVVGDQVDGTYLAVDETHGHINMPAALMWARGFEDRPVRVTFQMARGWRAATQLQPTGDPQTFTAPNLQYLMDSPTELSALTLRTFNVGQEFRLALHHDGSDAEAGHFAAALERVVREQRAVFGELPAFEGPYTFIADFLPYASYDGMEHRNSTILTGPSSMISANNQLDAVSLAAHEFFHVWNVERIRPRSLEPFRLDAPNPSGELWFAEGVTSYYELLTMGRAGFWNVERVAWRIGHSLDLLLRSPARKHVSAEDASRLAQFVDQALWSSPSDFENTFLSYYEWGSAIGLGLDLSLRARSNGAVTLDHFMRRLWSEFGKPAAAPGRVARPYSAADLRRVLADVSGDDAFAASFFDRYVSGREAIDYGPLLARAGLILRKARPGRPWIGNAKFEVDGGVLRVDEFTAENSPLHVSGVDRGDLLIALDGEAVSSQSRLDELVQRRKPGDRARLSIRRRGDARELAMTVEEDPRLEVVPVEATGRQPSSAERAFRTAWLGSQQ